MHRSPSDAYSLLVVQEVPTFHKTRKYIAVFTSLPLDTLLTRFNPISLKLILVRKAYRRFIGYLTAPIARS
jgi:hypothetical protein